MKVDPYGSTYINIESARARAYTRALARAHETQKSRAREENRQKIGKKREKIPRFSGKSDEIKKTGRGKLRQRVSVWKKSHGNREKISGQKSGKPVTVTGALAELRQRVSSRQKIVLIWQSTNRAGSTQTCRGNFRDFRRKIRSFDAESLSNRLHQRVSRARF